MSSYACPMKPGVKVSLISAGWIRLAGGWPKYCSDLSMSLPSRFARIACGATLKRTGSLPSKNPVRRFEDILDNIGLIKEYTRGFSYDGFVKDRKTQDAVERCLTRISEAAGKLEDSAYVLIPDQPWSEIRAVGNVLRHEYDSVDLLIVWDIVSRDLDSLKGSIEAALQRLRRQNPQDF